MLKRKFSFKVGIGCKMRQYLYLSNLHFWNTKCI